MSELSNRSRREVLLGGTLLGAMLLGAEDQASAALTVVPGQPDWRFCSKCSVLFWTSNPVQTCAAGGKHQPQGLHFRLPVDGAETPTAQAHWFCCRNCAAMTFAGAVQRGRCPANATYTTDRGHEADRTSSYVLPHDVPAGPRAQGDWRYCGKCMAMVFDGFPAKGVCPAGGGHVAQGYTFVLPFEA